MFVDKILLAKHEGKVQQFKVIAIMGDQLKLSNGEIEIIRFFWEVRSLPNEQEKN